MGSSLAEHRFTGDFDGGRLGKVFAIKVDCIHYQSITSYKCGKDNNFDSLV
jgi:hypothetical protein